MSFNVKVLVGNSAGQVVNIPGPKFYIGRSEDCQLRPRSDLISRHHCAFIVEGEYFGIRDFGSKNGTYCNGQRVIGECELKDGDKLTTLNGRELVVEEKNGTVRIDSISILPREAKISNGVLFVTNTVIQ